MKYIRLFFIFILCSAFIIEPARSFETRSVIGPICDHLSELKPGVRVFHKLQKLHPSKISIKSVNWALLNAGLSCRLFRGKIIFIGTIPGQNFTIGGVEYSSDLFVLQNNFIYSWKRIPGDIAESW